MADAKQHAQFEIKAGRRERLPWTAQQVDADTGEMLAIAFDAADDVLWTLAASEGGEAVVSLSKTPNANGSAVVIEELGDVSPPDPADWVPASGYVLLEPADTVDFEITKATNYFDELLLQDSADDDRLDSICYGIVRVRPSTAP